MIACNSHGQISFPVYLPRGAGVNRGEGGNSEIRIRFVVSVPSLPLPPPRLCERVGSDGGLTGFTPISTHTTPHTSPHKKSSVEIAGCKTNREARVCGWETNSMSQSWNSGEPTAFSQHFIYFLPQCS